MSEKLKPCPHCGSKEVEVVTGFSDYDFYVECGNCGCRSQTYINLGDKTDEECIDLAINSWNRRVNNE